MGHALVWHFAGHSCAGVELGMPGPGSSGLAGAELWGFVRISPTLTDALYDSFG